LSAFCTSSRIVDALCNASITRLRLDNTGKSFNHSKFTATRTSIRTESEHVKSASNTEATPAFNTQQSEDDISTIDHLVLKYFLCLQTLSTCGAGVVALFTRSDTVIELFDAYLDKCLSTFNDWEIKSAHSIKASVNDESVRNLVCLLSVLNSVFPTDDLTHLVECHRKHAKFFLKLTTLCNYFLRLFNEIKDQTDENVDSDWMVSFELAKSNMHDLFTSLSNLNGQHDAGLLKLVNESSKMLNQ
jgi:hypothetical protein